MRSSVAKVPGSKPGKAPRQQFDAAWIAVVAAMLVVAAIRVRLLSFPLERDEGEFAYMGQLMLQGVPPYSLAFNVKLPGIYGAYAAIMAVFGQTTAAIHLGLLLVNAAAIVMVFVLGRRLYGSMVGAIAAVSYAVLSIQMGVFGCNAHATHFVVVFALGGILALLRSLDQRSTGLLVCSGLLMGIAFLMKQPGLWFVVFGAAYLLWAERRRCVARLGVFLGSAALPFALTCLWLWRAGVFARFWLWAVDYAINYGSQVPPTKYIHYLLTGFGSAVWGVEALWISGAVGLPVALLWSEFRENRFFIVTMLLCSIAATSAAFCYRPHYFVLMLPVLSLLIGVAVVRLGQLLRMAGVKTFVVHAPLLIFLLAAAAPFARDRAVFFEMPCADACRRVYWPNPVMEAVSIGRYIREHTTTRDTIAVLGSEPEVFFYAHRRSATGHLYVYYLMEDRPRASRMQREMIGDIERARPKYIVDVRLHESWLDGPRTDPHILKWACSYLVEHYTPVAYFDLNAPARPPWTDDTIRRYSQPGRGVCLLRRKD